MKLDKKTILLFSSGALLGLGGGTVIGYLVRDRKVESEKRILEENYEASLERICKMYDDKIDSAAEQKAKDMLMEAAQRRVEARKRTQEPQDDQNNVSSSKAVEDPLDASDVIPEVLKDELKKAKGADYKPDPSVMVNRNVFDQSPDPTQAVDYTRMYKSTGKQEVVYGSSLTRDDRTTSGFAKSKSEIRSKLDQEEAQAALDAWAQGHTPEGFKNHFDDETVPLDYDPDAVLDDDEKAALDAECENEDRSTNAFHAEFITEDDYDNDRRYQKSFAMYCDGDDDWGDEDCNRIEDRTAVIGDLMEQYGFTVAQQLFDKGSEWSGQPERIFVRNPRVGTDYEVMIYHRNLYDMMPDPR